MVRIVAVGSAEECPVCDGNNDEQIAVNAWVEWERKKQLHD